MTSIMNLLQRYSGASAENAPASVREDFKQVAQGAQTDHLAGGLKDAFRSDQTPPFENMVAGLFGSSNGDQKAGILNQLLSSAGPALLSSGALAGLAQSLGSAKTITPQQAEQIPPSSGGGTGQSTCSNEIRPSSIAPAVFTPSILLWCRAWARAHWR